MTASSPDIQTEKHHQHISIVIVVLIIVIAVFIIVIDRHHCHVIVIIIITIVSGQSRIQEVAELIFQVVAELIIFDIRSHVTSKYSDDLF